MASTTSAEGATRRDFLYVATGAAGAVVAGSAVWPLVNQMNPSRDVLALASIKVDVGAMDEGSQMTVTWRGKAVFIRLRTEAEVAAARAATLDQLPDRDARNENLDDAAATDENRSFGERGEWLIMVGHCTHLGCVPVGEAGDYAGWYCPCHGSHYDTAGRIRRGPAPENLLIPVVAFEDEATVVIG